MNELEWVAHSASSLGFLETQGVIIMETNLICKVTTLFNSSTLLLVCMWETVRESSEGGIIKAFQLKVRQFINDAFLNFKSWKIKF